MLLQLQKHDSLERREVLVHLDRLFRVDVDAELLLEAGHKNEMLHRIPPGEIGRLGGVANLGGRDLKHGRKELSNAFFHVSVLGWLLFFDQAADGPDVPEVFELDFAGRQIDPEGLVEERQNPQHAERIDDAGLDQRLVVFDVHAGATFSKADAVATAERDIVVTATADGAIIGGIAGGGKGAGIGLILGGAGGAGSLAIQGSKELKIESGTEMLVHVTP